MSSVGLTRSFVPFLPRLGHNYIITLASHGRPVDFISERRATKGRMKGVEYDDLCLSYICSSTHLTPPCLSRLPQGELYYVIAQNLFTVFQNKRIPSRSIAYLIRLWHRLLCSTPSNRIPCRLATPTNIGGTRKFADLILSSYGVMKGSQCILEHLKRHSVAWCSERLTLGTAGL